MPFTVNKAGMSNPARNPKFGRGWCRWMEPPGKAKAQLDGLGSLSGRGQLVFFGSPQHNAVDKPAQRLRKAWNFS